jgi:hypothetical protein
MRDALSGHPPSPAVCIENPFLDARLLRLIGERACRLKMGQLALQLACSRQAFLFADFPSTHVEQKRAYRFSIRRLSLPVVSNSTP